MLIRNNLGLSKIVVMFDQAIYAKAVEIIWRYPDKFKDVIMRMGAFHIMCNLISIIIQYDSNCIVGTTKE